MRRSNLAGTISGKLKMVYDVLTLNQQMRVTYVLTLFGNLCIDPFHLAVSAIDSSNVITPWSSRGNEVELCAPGVNILSTIPGNSYASWSGTSPAASHVAGAAALCRGTHRYLDMDHIRTILRTTAYDFGNPGKDDKYGYGRVNCPGATFAKTCG
jgi:subtilisin